MFGGKTIIHATKRTGESLLFVVITGTLDDLPVQRCSGKNNHLTFFLQFHLKSHHLYIYGLIRVDRVRGRSQQTRMALAWFHPAGNVPPCGFNAVLATFDRLLTTNDSIGR